MTDFIYLDNAATTKPYERVLRVMDEAMRENWGKIAQSIKDNAQALQRGQGNFEGMFAK